VFEVSDVEYWYNEFDVRIMANTVHRRLSTCLTECTLVCRSLRTRWNYERENPEYTVADRPDGDPGHHP
jgi:hypothetical protein